MAKGKETVIIELLGRDRDDKLWVYKVVAAVNTLNPMVGTNVTDREIKGLIEAGVEVRIRERKT